MEHEMNTNSESKPNTNLNSKVWLIGIIILVVVLVGILAAIWAESTLFPQFSPFGPPPFLPGAYRFDFEFFYIAQTVVSSIDVALSIILLALYISIYEKTRSSFTIGLVIFSAVFLLDSIASDPLVIRLFGYRPTGLGPFALLPALFGFGALLVLLYLSAKY